MKKTSMQFCLAFLMMFNSSCIHTQHEEMRTIQELPGTKLIPNQNGSLEMDYLIYQESKLPMSDFFFHLRNGDYSKAFRQIDIRYKPANFQDEALTELVDAGFVPVYVKLKNSGTSPVEFDEKSFSLTSQEGSVKAFYAEQLPREFKRFSPKAVAANVYNTGVVVVGFAAVLGILILAHPHNMENLKNPPSAGGNSGSSNEDSLYNDTHKNIRVDYRNYLISKSKLDPGQETKGLLFFYIENSRLPPEVRLTFQ